MMRKTILLAVIASLSALVVGCGVPALRAPAVVERAGEVPLVMAPTPMPMPVPAEPPPYAFVDTSVSGVAEQYGLSEPMIVRTGDLSVVVEDTEQALEAIEDLATELEGYVSHSRSWRVNDQLAATITVRVPVGSFEEARDRIKDLALEVEAENISGQDVTEEYVDLEARLRNLEAAETELRELLASAQETRQKAEDILAIYRELTNIRGQIEQIQGRMKYLESAASLATLTVNLSAKEVEEPVVEPGWEPLRIARDAMRALVNALKALTGLLIWALVFALPIAALFALPFVLGWLGWFLRRRRRSRSKES